MPDGESFRIEGEIAKHGGNRSRIVNVSLCTECGPTYAGLPPQSFFQGSLTRPDERNETLKVGDYSLVVYLFKYLLGRGLDEVSSPALSQSIIKGRNLTQSLEQNTKTHCMPVVGIICSLAFL